MKKMLVTGGTVFVSQRVARYFADKFEVYVLNRNTRPQCPGVHLIQGDRHDLGNRLHGYHFDAVVDVTAYDETDVECLLNALESFSDYILISSSAVYPETALQPFTEETPTGVNRFWGKYGTGKIAAEKAARARIPSAYLLRPPYLYGPGNNIYREAFVFDCAMGNRPFYLPGDGSMKFQFLHVDDLCRFIHIILKTHPKQHIFNVGSRDAVTVREWVRACYEAAGKSPEFITVEADTEQRNYFPFYNYAYSLDVRRQLPLMPDTKPLAEGLREAFAWYAENGEAVRKKPFFAYIEQNFQEGP